MAKKSSNPADAFRKAQRAKELKKNKETRAKVRETQTIKRDTRDIEAEIRGLKGNNQLKPADKARLADLESELAHVNKVKEKYVSEHPEARDRVFRTHERRDGQRKTEGGEDQSQLYDADGKLRDPTRSIHYHPLYNPYGVPPPGMAYKEKTPEPGEEEEEDDEDSDENSDDDDIVLPEGPPPGATDSDSHDSDDIPLPEGPPPPRALPQPPLPPTGPKYPYAAPPIHFQPGQPSTPAPIHYIHSQPPPMPNPSMMPYPPPSGPPGSDGAGPSRPFRPRPPATVQDPLSDAPTQTYQGYRAAKHELPSRPDFPAAPAPTQQSNASNQTNGAGSGSLGGLPEKPKADYAAGSISAEPVMRDLRKEATTFVPRGVKRKKANAGGVSVNAAPGAGNIDEDGDEIRVRRVEEGGGLMGKLKGVLGPGQQSAQKSANGGGDDDYQKFLEGLQGMQ